MKFKFEKRKRNIFNADPVLSYYGSKKEPNKEQITGDALYYLSSFIEMSFKEFYKKEK